VAICRICDLPIGAFRIHEGCSTDKADCRGEIARMYNQLAEEIAGQTLRNSRMEAVKRIGVIRGLLKGYNRFRSPKQVDTFDEGVIRKLF